MSSGRRSTSCVIPDVLKLYGLPFDQMNQMKSLTNWHPYDSCLTVLYIRNDANYSLEYFKFTLQFHETEKE